jgi:hypothetical protein
MEVCQALLDAGANLHSRDNDSGATAFIMAAFQVGQCILPVWLHAERRHSSVHPMSCRCGEVDMSGTEATDCCV